VIDQLLVSSQTQSNELAGLYAGWRNNPLPEFEFNLAQNNRMVDLFPRQFLDVSLAADETPRGIAYAGNLIPRTVTLQYDVEAGCWLTGLLCEAETFAEIAVDGDIPPESGIGGFDLSVPPLPDFPDLPDLDVVYLDPSMSNANDLGFDSDTLAAGLGIRSGTAGFSLEPIAVRMTLATTNEEIVVGTFAERELERRMTETEFLTHMSAVEALLDLAA
jgi:hypothetical protein